MKFTSAEANKYLKKLNEELESLYDEEEMASSFLAAMGEDIESVRPAYDFDKMQEKIQELQKKIYTVKHAINKFNVKTVLPEVGLTIDSALVYIPILTNYKEKLSEKCAVLPKSREQCYGMGKSAIIDYRYANYNIDDAKKKYELVSERLSNIQLALDRVNSTVTFEIEI